MRIFEKSITALETAENMGCIVIILLPSGPVANDLEGRAREEWHRPAALTGLPNSKVIFL